MLIRIISVIILIGMGEWGWCQDIPTYSFDDKGNLVEHHDTVKAPEPLREEPIVGHVVDDRQMTHPYCYPAHNKQIVYMHANTSPGIMATGSTVTMDYRWD